MVTNLSVREFYRGKTVLVTGGTGFMGKVLLEKLLYTIPDIRVYVLIRPKWGKTVEQRVQDIRGSPVFNRIKKENAKVLQNIIPIEGDVLTENLGMSSEQIKTLSDLVSVIFHLAATVNMYTPLKSAVDLNTAGVKRVIHFARKCTRLNMFLHVSTTFCHPDYEVLEEKFYDPPKDPYDILRLCELLNEEQLALVTPSILGHHPNTYTYTKRLAESLVNDVYPDIPCVIARPSIVGPSLLDPMPGWMDKLQGPLGLMLAAGKGVLRTMLCDASLTAQCIPVDAAINALIAMCAIELSKKTKSENIPIYNLNAAVQEPVTWGQVLGIAEKYARKNPMAFPLWYPNGGFTTNKIEYEVKRILFHLLPAYFIDFIFLIARQKRFMVKIQEKISTGLKLLQYFTTREWYFQCPNFDAIHTTLSKEEDQIYVTYKPDSDKEQYIINAVETGRVYLLKEDPKKIPLNRIHHNFLFLLDLTVKIVFWCFVLSCLAAWFEPIRQVLSFGAPVVKHLPFLGRAVTEPTNQL